MAMGRIPPLFFDRAVRCGVNKHFFGNCSSAEHPLMEPLTLCTSFCLPSCHPSNIMPRTTPSLLGRVPCRRTLLSIPPLFGRSHGISLWPSTILTLLTSCTDPVSLSCLLGASSKESGAWLYAPPICSLSMRMSDDVMHTAISLSVGAPPHLPATHLQFLWKTGQ